LILWREFAWQDGRLKRGFRLSAEEILAAEQGICEFLKSSPPSRGSASS